MEAHRTELETLSSCFKEIALLLPNGENVKEMQSKSNMFGELSDIFCEVGNILRLFSRKRYHHKIENELKAINIKLAKSLKKLQLINLYSPEHDITNMLEEEESLYTALQAMNTKLTLFSSNPESTEPCCVYMEIKTLTDCIAEVVPLLHKCENDTDNQSKHILFRELCFVFSDINKTLQLFQSKKCHENQIASQLRLINSKAAKSLEKFRLVNLYNYNSKDDSAKMRICETSIEKEIEYKPNLNKLVESVEEKEDCFFTILQDLSTKLTSLISSNAKAVHSNITAEIKSLFTYVEEIKSFAKVEKDNPRKSDNLQAYYDELSEVFREIDSNFHFSSLKGGSSQMAIDLKKNGIKLGKVVKKIHSTSLNIMTDYDITKMKISNSPVRALTVSGRYDDKEKIIRLLFSYKDTRLMEPCLIPVVLENGEKPTKFCQNLIDDNRVKNHFHRIIWINSEHHIDHEKIYRLVRRKQTALFWVHKIIKDDSEKYGLLVIDGIKKTKLEPFYRTCYDSIDRTGMNGKKFIKIHTVKTERPPWDVSSQKLSLDEAWKRVEEACDRDKLDFELKEIGKKILMKVHKWKTNEIMVRALSRLLKQVELKHWKVIMESAFWKMPFYDETLITFILELCYTYDYERYTSFASWLGYVRVMRC